VAALGTNPVWQPHFSAVAALNQVTCGKGIVGATTITTTRSVLPLWMWGHALLLFRLHAGLDYKNPQEYLPIGQA